MTAPAPRRRYTSGDEDSARWDALALRDDDIVISTRSKHGTTWVQMLVALLLHGRPQLPAPLVTLSPWLDHLVEPLDDVVDRLGAQPHRRVIKTHTPLDGVPHRPGVTYVVVARHPLDAAVSLIHHRRNLDRERIRKLTGADGLPRPRPVRTVARELAAWVRWEADPVARLDSLDGVLHHLTDAWSRQREDPQVVLVHYADLCADLDREMRRLADLLGIAPPTEWDALVAAASLPAMRARADVLAPDARGILRDRVAFFRAGACGEGAALLDAADLEHYHRRVAAGASVELLAWLHR